MKANKVTLLLPSKILPSFLLKPHNMGTVGLSLTPAVIFQVMGTSADKFWALILKICTFLTKPHKMGAYGLAWTLVIIFSKFWAQWTYGTKFKYLYFSHRT